MRWLFAIALAAGCSGSSNKPPSPAAPLTGWANNLNFPPERTEVTPPTFRLPGDVHPLRERIDLTIDPARPTATGTVAIEATANPHTRIVWLNAADLQVHDASIAGKPATVVTHGDVVGLDSGIELPDGPFEIIASFAAKIDPERSRGMYSAIDHGEPYVYTFFEPIDARRAFPCFDEPSFKIPWTLVFHVREHDVALGNAPVKSETPEANGMKRVELAPSKPLPSYLVAFVVGPFDVIDDGLAGRANTPVRFVVPKGHADELGYAKQITPRVVGALEDYFDMPYPFDKLDVAVVPRYWGTMEHPGIVAMGQTLTLMRHDQETFDRELHYTNILAHELGHYWFGDLVTMAWWDDTWLNEALGTWLDMITTDTVAPEMHVRQHRIGLATRAMASDETQAALPIHRPVETRDAIEGSFDNDSTYFKGASIIRACEAFVGADKWRDFIRGYVRKHAGGNATHRDFIDDMRAALGDPAANAFDTYVSGVGVPLVSVGCDGDRLSVSRIRSLPPDPAGVIRLAWPTPVCVRFGDATHAKRECTITDAIPVAACPQWIEPNDNATGYYRSIIDPKLLDPKSPAKLSAAEKQMAVADLRAMVKHDGGWGGASIDTLLALVPVLAADRDPLVAMAAVGAADVRADAFDDATYAAYRAWRLRVLGPLARSLTWHRGKADSEERELLREAVLLRVGADDPQLARDAATLADGWLAKPTKLDDGLLDAALAVSAATGDAARFDRYVAAAKAAADTTDRQRMLGVLTSFRDSKLATRALELVIGHDFDIRDSQDIVTNALGNRWVRDALLDFLKAHLDEVLGKLRDDEQAWLLTAIAGAYCDAPHREATAELVKSHAANLAVARALEKAQQCEAEIGRESTALHRLVRK